ncbi:MAG: cation:proton antiporter [Thermoplasmatales archaeon]|nr:cation:proton antiporter [Candidatus Thermoplasmatota archaeon]MDA8054090.1 cation:proton antiporter [Thermoplasmatales archaeon]
MINTDELLLLLAGILLLGFVGEIAFRKKRIPDMLFLLLIGIIIHYTGIIPTAYLSLMRNLLGFVGTFALIFIVFGGVLRLDLKRFGKAVPKGVVMAAADLIFTILILTAILYYFLRMPFLDSLLLSAVLGETSVAFIVPLISRINLGEDLKHIVEVETIMNSVMNIIAVLLILSVINQQVSVVGLAGYLFGSISEAIVLGGVVGILWLIVLRQALTPHYYIATIAMLFVLWGVSDYVGASAILTVFVFSVIMANSLPVSKIVKISGIIDTESLTYFNQEITFFVMTLFYVYIGILVNIFDFRGIMIAVFLVALLIVIRFFEVFSVQGVTKWFGKDTVLMSSFVQRGSTVIVLAGILLSADPTVFTLFGNILFYVVIISIFTGSVLFSILSKRYMAQSIGGTNYTPNEVKSTK